MSLVQEIQDRVRQLPLEKQSEVLEFITLLQGQLVTSSQPSTLRALHEHPAFGSWHGRKIDALQYEQALRGEWDRET